jgi:hypothetical protein
MLVIFQVDEQLLTSQGGLSSMELISDLHVTTVTEKGGPSKMSINFYQMTLFLVTVVRNQSSHKE